MNQLYKTPVELQLDKNPDLRAIRFASLNPILDPWIYILLCKAVLLKLLEKIKCLFCKIGARRQQRNGGLHCRDGHQLSSVISNRDSHSLVSHDLPDVTNSSQSFFYIPEGRELCTGGCRTADGLSWHSSLTDLQASCSPEPGSGQPGSGQPGSAVRADRTEDPPALPSSKDPALQVSLSTQTVAEKCI